MDPASQGAREIQAGKLTQKLSPGVQATVFPNYFQYPELCH